MKNGIAVIKLDSPNSKVNTLNVETMTEVKEIMDLISKDPNIHASVLMSGMTKFFYYHILLLKKSLIDKYILLKLIVVLLSILQENQVVS